MSGKYALIIANTEYSDTGLSQLTAPGKDAEDFARVLREKEFCAFDDVNILLNQPSSAINEAIDEFFEQKKQDDLLVLYFSGHGVRDELGALYLAVKNTNRFRLRSTAIKSDFIKEAMDQSRSRRQVLILDCCNSGAFAQGTKAATGMSVGTATAFEGGYGRVILTASDSTQFAWEGDKVIGNTDNSLFTHYLVEGLKGNADRDGDGHITVDELYDYAYEKVRLATPKQTPSKFATKQQGEIILRQNIRIEDIKAIPLPDDLITATKSSIPYVREAAVKQLAELLNDKNRGLARSAKEILEYIAQNDDSKNISRAAFQALESIRQVEQVKFQEAEHLAKAKIEARQLTDEKRLADEAKKMQQTKAEAERLANEKAEKERLAKAKIEAEQLAEEKRLSDEAEKERRAQTERLTSKKAEAERLAAQKAEKERLAKVKLEADQPTEKAETERKIQKDAEKLAAQKTREEIVGLEVTQQAEEKSLIEESEPVQDIGTPFYIRWYGRVVIGGIIGSIVMLFYLNSFLYAGDAFLFVLAGCLTGFILYPRKLSLIFLVLGFLVISALNYNDLAAFWAYGFVFGLPAGSLISRILYWVKVIK